MMRRFIVRELIIRSIPHHLPMRTDRKDEQAGGIPPAVAGEFSDDLFAQSLCPVGVKAESKGNDHREAVQHVQPFEG